MISAFSPVCQRFNNSMRFFAFHSLFLMRSTSAIVPMKSFITKSMIMLRCNFTKNYFLSIFPLAWCIIKTEDKTPYFFSHRNIFFLFLVSFQMRWSNQRHFFSYPDLSWSLAIWCWCWQCAHSGTVFYFSSRAFFSSLQVWKMTQLIFILFIRWGKWLRWIPRKLKPFRLPLDPIRIGLVMLIGIIMYISLFKSEVGSKLRPRSMFQPPLFAYKYGHSFILFVVGCISAEIVGTLNFFCTFGFVKLAARR